MTENGISISEHRWSEDVWNTTQLGFMLGIDPQFYSDVQAHERPTQAIVRKLPPGSKVPKFKMVFCTPQTEHNNIRLRTKAFAVETEKHSSVEMMKLMKEVCKDSHEFVPLHMRYKHPEAFRKVIMENTRVMSENCTIVLNYIGTDAMYYLQDRILNIPGVRDLMPCPSVQHDGKFKIQVRKQDFQRIRKDLMKQLPKWYADHVAEDAK